MAAERKGAIEKIKRVQVDGLVREGPTIGTIIVCFAHLVGGAEGDQALSGRRE